MAAIGIPTINAPNIPEDVSRPLPARDATLKGVLNSGVRFFFDLAFPWCYPGGALVGRPAAGAPSNGATVQDMSEHANGNIAEPAGAIDYAGGGIDLTNGQNAPAGVIAPAAALADIATAYAGKVQRYLVVGYVKLPTSANWNASGTILTIMGEGSYSTGASLISISQNSGGTLQLRRQTAAGVAETIGSLTPAAGDYGSVVQIAAWRNDAGQGFRLKSANGAVLVTAAVGADNTQDFSAKQFCWGRPNAFTGVSSTAALTALSGFRVFRGWIENLARSGRDPVTVLDADWAREVTRAAFS